MIRSSAVITFAAVAALVSAGCRSDRCQQCEPGYGPPMQGPVMQGPTMTPTPADGTSSGLPAGVPPAPAALGGLRLPRIALPQFSSDPNRPSLMQRVKYGLSRLNPFRREPEAPADFGPYVQPDTLQPIPESQLPSTAQPPLAPPVGSGPQLQGPQASWNRYRPWRNSHRPISRSNTSGREVEDWPHATVPGRVRGSESPPFNQPDVASNLRPGSNFRPARFSASTPYMAPQPQGEIRTPQPYRSYRSAQPMLQPVPVRNFD